MFKKIRNRFLLLNMAMVSTVLIAAFLVIFFTTYTQVQSENRAKLVRNDIMTQMVTGPAGFLPEKVIHSEPASGNIFIAASGTPISPHAGLSFSILVDSQGEVVGINSILDLPEEAYEHIATDILATPDSNKTIVAEGRRWQHLVSPIFFTQTDDNGFSVSFSRGYRAIRLVDVTDSYDMLRSLGLTLAGLTLIILTAFFFTSRFFAGRAIRPMEEAWEKQSRFVADASHELKTPLSVINANCAALYANKEESVETQLKWVDNIMSGADRMAGLIGSLLSLTHMEDVEQELLIEDIDMSTVMDGAVEDMEASMLDKGLSIEKNIYPEIFVESDAEQLRQVLNILLDNAVKYTENGGSITVSLTKEKRQAICTVRNTGAGIAAEDLPRIFDRFYRVDPARSSENKGYGLGLAIAKAISERLHANLNVDSKEGEYTEFMFTIMAK